MIQRPWVQVLVGMDSGTDGSVDLGVRGRQIEAKSAFSFENSIILNLFIKSHVSGEGLTDRPGEYRHLHRPTHG